MEGAFMSTGNAWPIVALVSVFSFYCQKVQASAFIDETRAAVLLYSSLTGLDTKTSDTRLFGLKVERHGHQSKASMMAVNSSDLVTYEFACESGEQGAFCQPLKTSEQINYVREGSLFAGDFLLTSLIAISDYLEKRGVDPQTVSLFKVWHAKNGLQARIGFDAGLVEVAFVCDPRKAVVCRLAETELQNEP